MQVITIVAMLVAAAGVTFALQNNVPVAVAFLLWRFEGSLAMVLLLTLAVGAFIVALVSTPSTLRRQWAIAKQNRRITELEGICDSQKEAIARLEGRLPVTESPPAESVSYVGLKQIVGGAASPDGRNPPPHR